MSLQLLLMFHRTELLPVRYKGRMFTVELTVLRSVRQIDLPDYPTSLEHLFHGLLDLIYPTTILPLKMLLSVAPASSQLQACPSPLDRSHPLQVSFLTPGCSPSASPFYLQPSLHPHCRLPVKGAGALKRKQGHTCYFVRSDVYLVRCVCTLCQMSVFSSCLEILLLTATSLETEQVMFPREQRLALKRYIRGSS